MWSPPSNHPLRRLFAGITEQTFIQTLGVGDPPLVDYLSELLSRFLHLDAIYRLRDAQGKRLEEVADMMVEAGSLPPEGRTCREYHRHIGDFALFWMGVYPESLRGFRTASRKDHLIDYCAQGKRSYLIASSYEDTPSEREQAPVLRRLSSEFEIFAFGLNQVRREWERLPQQGGGDGPTPELLH